MNLYLTQDRIGSPGGGGSVTFHEYRALSDLGDETHPFDAMRVPLDPDPFVSDRNFRRAVEGLSPKLVHCYAGCFSETLSYLKSRGAKITYTAAAHDIQESRREFEELGMGHAFPRHLTDPELLRRYVDGYLMADIVICPSSHSKRVMLGLGARRVEIVPHGCDPAKNIVQPKYDRFRVGYLGQAGPDKGLRYLFEAWKRLDLKDATLVIAGNNIEQALPLWRRFGGGNVEFTGYVKELSDFFGRIHVYVQPSVTEGFGIEILEAMAHGVPVIASSGAGASEWVSDYDSGTVVEPRDVDHLCEVLASCRPRESMSGKERLPYLAWNWSDVNSEYKSIWKGLIS